LPKFLHVFKDIDHASVLSDWLCIQNGFYLIIHQVFVITASNVEQFSEVIYLLSCYCLLQTFLLLAIHSDLVVIYFADNCTDSVPVCLPANCSLAGSWLIQQYMTCWHCNLTDKLRHTVLAWKGVMP